MPTATQTTKKQAQPLRSQPRDKPHKDLKPIQEEMAELAADLLMNGGSQSDLRLFLKSLLRHRFRRFRSYVDCGHAEGYAQSSAQSWLERSATQVIKHWPESRSKQSQDRPKPTTVADIARLNLRGGLRDQFDGFLTDTKGLEQIWVLSELLGYCNDTSYDLAQAFATLMESDGTYVRIPSSKVEKVHAFVELLGDDQSE